MLTEPEIHKGLLAIQDREYRVVLDHCRSKGFDMPIQGALACRRLDEEARAGDKTSQFALAKLLSIGLFVKRDWAKALEWARCSANSEFAPAWTMLGNFYESGSGGLQGGVDTAVAHWRRAAAVEEPGAMFALAEYLLRKGDDASRAQAFSLLSKVSSTGDALAQCRLGMLMLSEHPSPSLQSEGVTWIQMAADNGNSTAHRQLAKFLSEGLHGLAIDRSAARQHLSAASKLDEQFD